MSDPRLAEYLQFLRFPSISTDPERKGDVAACAAWLERKLTGMGLETRVVSTAGHPIVLAKNAHQPGRRTVMIYGHYDVQPVDPVELWTSPPFEPRIENDVVFARGAADNKGQIFAHVLGLEETLKEKGELPVNLVLLIEGEEEVGSAHLEEFLLAHREDLRCDVIAISDTGMIAKGYPTFTYGLRGIGALELKVTGPGSDLHSGIYGGAVANPATAVARLVASLHDENGHVAVPGFYDDVAPLQDWERAAWARLPFGDEDLLKVTGSRELFGEAGFTSLERTWARPTAEVNGIGGGFQGVGTKTVLPQKAFAKLTFRLVPNQQPDDVMEKVKAHLRTKCPPGVQLEISGSHAGEPYFTDPQSADGQAAQRALQRAFPGKDLALIREGGSIPIVNTFKRVLGAETLLLGLALPDCRAHAPDENFPLANFFGGIGLNRALLEELAG
ncbi:acetylornithine deacetylase/succinyl-diaminopimelate desuccinylase-like protein [Chthoniobacter flavus]|nr:dipeptidase [Chthoniobacter flavus]TCO94879.1 acetylornithine deacetylase/succinyl-diaminopimelate desuccinylase-like protein [Chthoniobacter flavus]